MNKLWAWLRSLWNWLSELKHFWLAVAVTGIALFISLRPGTAECTIRLSGLALQILGIGTIAWGISETRALFGRPSLFAVAKSWLRSFPPFHSRVVSGTANITLGGVTMSGRGYGMDNAGPNATPEARIEVLEKNIRHINERIDQTQREMDTELRNAGAALKREEQARATEDQAIRHKLETSETGGIHVTAMGALWLLIGVTLSTASPEIAKWLQ